MTAATIQAPALVRLPVRQNTDEWLAMRRTGITASDLPILMGNKKGIHELWAFKTGLIEQPPVDDDTQEMFDIGHDLEPIIARRYTLKTGRELIAVPEMVAHHGGIPWLFASLDRVAADGSPLIAELKWVPWSQEWAGPEAVPAAVQDQVQGQLLVTGWPMGHVVVFRGARVEWHEVPADPDYQKALLKVAMWFRDLVERRIPPPVDGSEETRRTLGRLYPADTLDLLDPTAELEALAREERAADAAAEAAVNEHERLRNVLRQLLGEHAGVEGDGWRVTFKKYADSDPKDETAWELLAGDLLKLVPKRRLKDAEALRSIHTRTVPGRKGNRPLVVRLKSEETGKWI